MEFKMKNIMRRQVLALMLGVTTLAIAASVSHRAYAEDGHSEQENSSHHDSVSGDDGPDHDANDDNGGENDDGPDHDANDDGSGSSDDESSNSSSGAGNSDCAIASVNCSKKAQKK
jgi:cobalamin biosynthesis protein CobT